MRATLDLHLLPPSLDASWFDETSFGVLLGTDGVPRSVLSRFEIRPGIARGLETLDSKGSKENGSSSSNLQPQVKSKENAK
ncbi:hypothetical protein VTJ04DRAFT_2437 [Mycothermus thermophilus]|uniref:uncharacterized protein n=1 Tax=Humicola insolens TaxID=85995 RepID=UPI003742CD2B